MTILKLRNSFFLCFWSWYLAALIAIAVLFFAGRGEAAEQNFEPKDTVLRFSEVKSYRLKITPEATLDDIKWLFNEGIWFCVGADEAEKFRERGKAFKLEDYK